MGERERREEVRELRESMDRKFENILNTFKDATTKLAESHKEAIKELGEKISEIVTAQQPSPELSKEDLKTLEDRMSTKLEAITYKKDLEAARKLQKEREKRIMAKIESVRKEVEAKREVEAEKGMESKDRLAATAIREAAGVIKEKRPVEVIVRAWEGRKKKPEVEESKESESRVAEFVGEEEKELVEE